MTGINSAGLADFAGAVNVAAARWKDAAGAVDTVMDHRGALRKLLIHGPQGGSAAEAAQSQILELDHAVQLATSASDEARKSATAAIERSSDPVISNRLAALRTSLEVPLPTLSRNARPGVGLERARDWMLHQQNGRDAAGYTATFGGLGAGLGTGFPAVMHLGFLEGLPLAGASVAALGAGMVGTTTAIQAFRNRPATEAMTLIGELRESAELAAAGTPEGRTWGDLSTRKAVAMLKPIRSAIHEAAVRTQRVDATLTAQLTQSRADSTRLRTLTDQSAAELAARRADWRSVLGVGEAPTEH